MRSIRSNFMLARFIDVESLHSACAGVPREVLTLLLACVPTYV